MNPDKCPIQEPILCLYFGGNLFRIWQRGESIGPNMAMSFSFPKCDGISVENLKKNKSVFFINYNEIRRRREIYLFRDVREIIYSAITYHDFIWINDHDLL